MTSKEEWDFVNSLKFDEQLEYEEAYFIKMNYISMLKKYEHVIESQEARSELENKFRLSNNAGIYHGFSLRASVVRIWAIELEHDQAIAAAAKLYPGSHLPTLFIGMQHLQAKNLLSAEEYLLTNSQICESAIGIKRVACALFSKAQNALKVAEETKCRPQVWETIWIQLGHAFRQLGELDIAESYFQKVVSMSPPIVDALTA
ncbi:hypothetical protein C2G38_2214124 [Gigaspora rosea]|uniref:Uncharacterized protein n=1 Tax=Gigaspora rosea TaxID=44941 RepID=A0A397UD60_9GLOM|nr:hypothetical protein C2G38_2214124 [Gigaspora rosea]